jgi:hypothetical protein
MTTFASGKHALAISDRSGLAFPYLEMVREWNGAWVHFSEFEPKQPQLEPKPTSADPQALQRARPARTEFATEDFLPVDPFSTAGTTTLTFRFPYGGLLVDDQVRFTSVKSAVGGVSITALELNATLSSNITSTATSIAVNDSSSFPSAGYIVIRKTDTDTASLNYGRFENETIQYTGNSANTFTGCTRGTAAPYRGNTPVSTTASAHSSGAEVFGSHKIVTRVATTVDQAGVPSTVTEYNSFTLTLPSAASTTETGGGINCVVGPVNQRRG